MKIFIIPHLKSNQIIHLWMTIMKFQYKLNNFKPYLQTWTPAPDKTKRYKYWRIYVF